MANNFIYITVISEASDYSHNIRTKVQNLLTTQTQICPACYGQVGLIFPEIIPGVKQLDLSNILLNENLLWNMC
jgi:hypothetical protein